MPLKIDTLEKIMKKVLKITGIILLIIVIMLVALVTCVSKMPSAPKDYNETVATGGAIEKKYMANGNYEVEHFEEITLQGFSKYIYYYPKNLESDNEIYPVIVLVNGSGTPMSKYTAIAKHYASWGFIVIGTEEDYDWNGFSPEMCIRHLTLLNENEIVNDNINVFYKKVDLENVGIVGHSQGGVGVVNALTEQKHGDIYKAAVMLSPANKELARGLQWDYDASKVNIPILLMSGEGGGDDAVVTGEQLEEIYNDIANEKIMLRRKNTAHGEMLYSCDGYVTAWFMYWLQGDEEAGGAFFGENVEIERNELYVDVKIDFENIA